MDYNNGLESAVAEIKALPSAEAEQGSDAKMTGTSPYMQPCPDSGADLISRADAIEVVLTYFIPRTHTGERGEYEEDFVRTIFKALPSAEAVEVVRCKDCRHTNECHKSVQYTRNEQNTVTIGYTKIDFCSHGERRT